MKTTIQFLLAFLFLGFTLSAQQIGHTTFTFIDSTRSNRQITAEIYYPATSTGNNTPIAAGVFPLIAFGHGFVMDYSAYQNYWETLVPEGYIMAFPTTEGSFSPSHADFGKDLAFLITKMQGSGAGVNIPVASVGTTSAIMGHSMGGGSSFLAAENNQAITTMVSFAAANTNPSSIAASKQVSVPTLLFSGTNDCVAPPAQHQDIMYDSTAATFITQVNILGGGHCFFANSNFNCTFGESTCGPSPTITRAQQQSITNNFLKPWLAYFLKNDCQKGQEFQDSLTMSATISHRQNQAIGCATGITNVNFTANTFTISPNPFSKQTTLQTSHPIHNGTLTVYNCFGQKVREMKNISGNTITLSREQMPSGFYYLRLTEDNKQTETKKIIITD
jgi:pimeloyl-ACP methyl ester carboxylesterase